MSALDKLRSFAESHELDRLRLPDASLSYADAREAMASVDQLRASLATVTAALESELEGKGALVDELTETKAALHRESGLHTAAVYGSADTVFALEASRAETAAATARIAELEADVERFSHGKLAVRCETAETALRELREKVEKAVARLSKNTAHCDGAIAYALEALRGQ